MIKFLAGYEDPKKDGAAVRPAFVDNYSRLPSCIMSLSHLPSWILLIIREPHLTGLRLRDGTALRCTTPLH